MSSSLVRKALALFEEKPSGLKTKRGTSIQHSTKKTKRHLIKQKHTLKDQKVKSAVDEYKRKLLADQTDHNLKMLQQLSDKKTEAPIVKKILNRMSNAQVQEEVVAEEPTTVFSEEDFAWFEKNYKIRKSV